MDKHRLILGLFVCLLPLLFTAPTLLKMAHEDERQNSLQQELKEPKCKMIESYNSEKFYTYDCGDYLRICDKNPTGYSGCLMMNTTRKVYDSLAEFNDSSDVSYYSKVEEKNWKYDAQQ